MLALLSCSKKQWIGLEVIALYGLATISANFSIGTKHVFKENSLKWTLRREVIPVGSAATRRHGQSVKRRTLCRALKARPDDEREAAIAVDKGNRYKKGRFCP
jgi:hypothetical protein